MTKPVALQCGHTKEEDFLATANVPYRTLALSWRARSDTSTF